MCCKISHETVKLLELGSGEGASICEYLYDMRKVHRFRKGVDITGVANVNKDGEGTSTLKDNMMYLWYLEKVLTISKRYSPSSVSTKGY